ncbi:hypothetical protein [Candidatus Methylomicrobium oryzae]|jgi:hypothetical protein|uniref:hypothetical protein n=1 Tax=Candidatus Methylomicrobium oryzae TaxID=2802053 RepID=UPI0019238EC0|nr:hypothetical protein [Methylomicrobium sp. RS1]MBL1265857.1 hypothetical protein [Methylomicrobium sp. RS1]
MNQCDHCQNELSDRRVYLDRNVQVFCYSNEGELVQAQALYSDSLKHFCSVGCADVSVPEVMDSLGLSILPPTTNPVGTCAKCNGPVDMTAPHVAYVLMEATKVTKPWLTHLEVHNDEYLCVVCPNCDGQLMQEEWQIADEDEAALSDVASARGKETA